jgi:myo-inositol-1(or 4)-monophosphatase
MPDSAPDDLARRRRVAEEAARAAGEIHRRYYGTNVAFEAKADPRDVLTKADIESQAAIKAIIREAFPEDVIAGEEDGLAKDEVSRLLDGAVWTVDPLDATQGFVHNFPVFGPGIAYVVGRQPLVGVMYMPVYDELFSAARGQGATLNGASIRVSVPKPLRDCLVGLHIREVEGGAAETFLETTGRVLKRSHGIRLLGGPMFSMAYVAAGRLDCFATLSPTRLGPWDLAPAAVVLEEAGGVVADEEGRPLDLMRTGVSGASSRALLDELFAVARGEA